MNIYLLKRMVLKMGVAILAELIRVVDQQAKAESKA